MIPSPLDLIVLILLLLAVAHARRDADPPRPAAGGGAEADPLPVRRDRTSRRPLSMRRFASAEPSTPPWFRRPWLRSRSPFRSTPQPRQAAAALPVLEAVEHRALNNGVPVDSRIERGRSPRHALRELASHERFDRIVVAAGNGHGESRASMPTTSPGCSTSCRGKSSFCVLRRDNRPVTARLAALRAARLRVPARGGPRQLFGVG